MSAAALSVLSRLLVVILVLCSIPARAREVYDISATLQPQDWYQLHRSEYRYLSRNLRPRDLIAAIPQYYTFSNAVTYNTKNVRADEYTNITQRNAYYDLISLIIEHDPNTPASLRNVRFFHATTHITGPALIGAVDGISDWATPISDESRDFLRKTSTRLFRLNMEVINKLLFVWKEPRNPLDQYRVDAFAFDLAMVCLEQDEVERTIKELAPSSRIRSELNKLNNEFEFTRIGGISRNTQADQWVRKTIQGFDFFKVEHRRAMGFALVAMYHRKSESEFTSLLSHACGGGVRPNPPSGLTVQ